MELDEDQSFKNRLSHYQSLDSMEGVEATPEAGPTNWFMKTRVGGLVYSTYPGVLAAGTIAIAASWLSTNYNAPVMLFALLLGIALAFLSDCSRTMSPTLKNCRRRKFDRFPER